MEATTDRATVMNMAYHGYWNLAGHDSGHIRDQLLLIDADRYTPVGPGKIPTGELASVAGTAFDFRSSRPIGTMIDDHAQLPEAGYDHNFCLDGDSGPLHRAARALDPFSGRGLEIWTNQPGVQFYTANHFGKAPATGKGGARYEKHAGFALETQNYPNAPNISHFPRPCFVRARPIAMRCAFRSSPWSRRACADQPAFFTHSCCAAVSRSSGAETLTARAQPSARR